MSQLAALDLLREAMTAARANNPGRTRELLIEVTRLDAANETAWQWLAGVAESPLEATAALEQVLLLNPKNEKARTALRPVRLQAAIAAAKGKDILTARRLLRTVVADDPNSEQGWFWLASVCDSPFEALSHLQRVLQLNPGNTAAKKGIDYYNNKLSRLSGTVPVAGNTRPGDPAVPLAMPATPPPPRTLLIVDASRTIRKLVAMATAGDGFTVIEAADAEEAVERLHEHGTPDLVLADSAMTGMDGYEFCKVMRQTTAPKRVPFILFTAKDSLFDKLRGKMVGVDGELPKPFDPDDLLIAIRACCPVERVPVH